MSTVSHVCRPIEFAISWLLAVLRIDREGQPVGIAKAVRPDLLPRARRCDERVVIRNAVPAVLAHDARRFVRLEIRDDAEDLSDQRVETLRIGPDGLPRFARAAVTAADVHHAPLGIARPCRRIENEIAHRMDARVELDAHQLAGGALERRVADVGVGPFDQHAVAQDVAGRCDGLRRLVAAHVETGRARRVGRCRRVDRWVFDVHRVEPAVPAVVRVELDADEAVGVAGLEREAMEESGVTLAAVEVEIDRELLRSFVEDVERSVQIVDEQSIRAAGFLAQCIDARQHAVGLPVPRRCCP